VSAYQSRFADRHCNAVHLFERDCSCSAAQKIIEVTGAGITDGAAGTGRIPGGGPGRRLCRGRHCQFLLAANGAFY
jgi:biotin carboxylase